MPCYTIQVSRPFGVVARQVLELDEAWLADAARSAGVGTCGETPPRGERAAGFHVRIGSPCRTRGRLRLPMEWEVTGNVAPWALRGDLEVRQVSAGETRIGVKMALSTEPAVPQASEPVRVAETAELVTRLFLSRVFWTLEALSRDGASARGTR